MLRRTLLLTGIIFGLAVPASAEMAFTTIGSFTSPARVVYYGTDFFPQTGNIDLGEEVTGRDTTYSLWLRFPGNPTLTQLGVERLPFDSKANAKDPPALTEAQQQRYTVERQVGQQLRTRQATTTRSESANTATAMSERIALYKAKPNVDSVWVDPDHSATTWWVKWKGSDYPERMVISPRPPKLPAARRRISLINEAERLLVALRGNQIVIIDNGFRHASSPAGREVLEQDLDALRRGQTAATFFPKHVREHLQQSVDLRLVVEGGIR